MVLARLLTPEAFGVVATVSMIISFAEIFTDAGFQRYIIQNEFSSDKQKYEATNVAFLTNLFMSLLIWGLIIAFNEPLARLVGNPGLGHVIIISCVSLPLAAFSSIQIALFKRDFDFKTLFYVRLIGIIIPIIVTIPLAIVLKNYWALIIGIIAVNLSNAILLTLKSNWKPDLNYKFSELKKMFPFCGWTIIDTILVWGTGYFDIFIIGVKLNEHYLGIYKTSMSLVNQIMSIIIAAATPVIFSSLSRLQKNIPEFKNTLLRFQKYVGMILIPLGVGILMYSDLLTQLLLGNQWQEASGFIGIWGFMGAITIIFSRFCSISYPALGKPRLSVLAQILHIVVLIPTILIGVQYGFKELYLARSLIRFELILVNLIIMYYVIKLSPWQMLLNIMPSLLVSFLMAIISLVLKMINDSILWSMISIIICIIFYFMLMTTFPKERKIILNIKSQIKYKLFPYR